MFPPEPPLTLLNCTKPPLAGKLMKPAPRKPALLLSAVAPPPKLADSACNTGLVQAVPVAVAVGVRVGVPVGVRVGVLLGPCVRVGVDVGVTVIGMPSSTAA